MYKVLYNKKISTNSYEMAIVAPAVIKKALPGQFVIVMSKEDGERIILEEYYI
jgi:NAD(P)H-flavin reductase